MKPALRKLISLVVLAVILLCFLSLRAAVRGKRLEQTCNGVSVEFKEDWHFITEDDVKGYLDAYYGAYIGQRLDSLKLYRIEQIVDVQSAVLKSQAYVTDDDGMLHILISQRDPIVRFETSAGGFYADEKGFIFPLQSNYTSRVPIVDGAVPLPGGEGYKGAPQTEEQVKWMNDILTMLGYMDKSKIWAENIVQIHVDESGDIILIPREGKEKFIFGGPEDAQAKFDRMAKYYQYIRPEKGEDFYSSVNVKYDKQIVCKK